MGKFLVPNLFFIGLFMFLELARQVIQVPGTVRR